MKDKKRTKGNGEKEKKAEIEEGKKRMKEGMKRMKEGTNINEGNEGRNK